MDHNGVWPFVCRSNMRMWWCPAATSPVFCGEMAMQFTWPQGRGMGAGASGSNLWQTLADGFLSQAKPPKYKATPT